MNRETRLARSFRHAREAGRLAFVPFLMGGDPDLDTTARLIRELDRLGSDLIEIGVPYSDPVADGEVNQRAAERALGAATTLEGVLDRVAGVRDRVEAGLILFTYFNPVLRFGTARFARRAAAAGVDAVLVVDLPPEESGPFRRDLAGQGVAAPALLAPTTPDDRVRRIAAAAGGFLYYVSRTGVTGPRANLDGALKERLVRIRSLVNLPLVVGFGISRREHLDELRGLADGVVVGSALVERVAGGGTPEEILDRVGQFIRELRAGESC